MGGIDIEGFGNDFMKKLDEFKKITDDTKYELVRGVLHQQSQNQTSDATPTSALSAANTTQAATVTINVVPEEKKQTAT